jgi:hypothetical protein
LYAASGLPSHAKSGRCALCAPTNGFGTDKNRIRTKTTVIGKNKRCLGIIQDRRSRTDALLIRARSVIRAAGTSAAQVPSPHLAV